jgi:hypothetical protein
VQFFDAQVPATSSTPISGAVGGTNYNYVINSSGSYGLSTLSGTVYVGANATLYVSGSTAINGIVIAPTACLKLYTGASSVSISGNGVANASGKAWNFQLYGLPSLTSISFSGNAQFNGVIYAPEVNFTLNGGGNNTFDFSGAAIVNTVTLNGHFNFHYDESLAAYGPGRDYIPVSWNELTPDFSVLSYVTY